MHNQFTGRIRIPREATGIVDSIFSVMLDFRNNEKLYLRKMDGKQFKFINNEGQYECIITFDSSERWIEICIDFADDFVKTSTEICRLGIFRDKFLVLHNLIEKNINRK